mmetsp:Transcript_15773/g.24207  ORF Transcript_15773/g.24207 Transcript_15773/m.24207 type:complete len:525 (+) Transcript_15773:97-1671(+)|eukprot:CAMPEP_0202685602 /NCGR_PEP_ID=MMETSP1385-20130828/1401_1 /ASSEMBLY_ACC=CAM_ASM_000861 /TAXON_ID=933848 /ORGANISM="Elphidium margaritaceum" /LENGTH=524 /DNA_ID=CAMNT_0049339997 /DNA_START=66 /DNA_END=1640 /DNA_ORIENTATION=-
MTAASDDMLGLSQNVQCQKMLSKMGDNFPEQERVVLSVKCTKINKRGKEQNRILLLTDKALYNLKPKEIRKCQRRIDLEKIVSITISGTSLEFAIHIPEEYDYRYKSAHKDRIAAVLAELYKRKEGKKLAINKIQTDSMLAVTVTKDVARLQTREQRLRRYQELIGKDNYDDEVNDAASAKVTGQLIDSKEKVKPDDFEFLKVIGRGSFGKVMQVRKKDNGEIFAMKILKKKALIAKHQVEHTNAERKILQSLQHPFLMHLRYAFQTEAKLYFVLDYYRGGELFFHLKKKRRFSEEQAKIFVAEVALALGHLHSLDVIYRDLKPENILLDHTGHICLTDFGLSKDLGPDNEDAHTFCGTPEYLAPEIVMNLGHGKAVDWWALGILLYELTVGIPPFYSQNVNEMYRKIQEAPLLFPPNLSNPCKDLITKLLQRDPKIRMGSGLSDVDDIKNHAFFSDLDWEQLMRREIEAPYRPNVKSADDTSNFDDIFLKEAVVDSHVAPPTLHASKKDGFEDFTFAPKKGAL